MSLKSQFPWEALKAECLRTVCTQLMQSTGAHYSEVRRREDMITFLKDVEKRGLDKAAQMLQEDIKNEPKVQRPASPAKRKAEATEEEQSAEEEDGADGYNTRYKGVKRVKVRAATPERTRTPRQKQVATATEGAPSGGTAEGAESASAGPPAKRGRGRPRKSIATNENNATSGTGGSTSIVESNEPRPKRVRGAPRKSDATPAATSAASGAEVSVKRPRGRPRKHPLPVSTSSAPASKGKEVFDGVLMKKRAAPAKGDAPSADRVAEDDGGADEDAAGDDEHDDPVLLNGHLNDGSSSLGGSNKENEPMFSDDNTPDRDTQDADAQGEPDPNVQEVVATGTVETVDITHSAVIMPTIPMALAAAAAPRRDSVQPLPRDSTPQDRTALHPL